MSATSPVFQYNNSTDINNYVKDSDPVPQFCERNRDGSLILGEFEMKIFNTWTTTPAVGAYVDAYVTGVATRPFFLGEVVEVKTDIQEECWVLKIKSILHRLQDRVLCYDNLHTQLTQTTNYNEWIALDNFSLSNAQVLYAIESMVLDALSAYPYLSFFISSILSSKVIKTIEYVETNYDMEIQHLVMDENVLYALNQDYAINTAGIEADADKTNKQITYWDFISEFCSHFNASISLSGGFPKSMTLGLVQAQSPPTTESYINEKSIDKVVGLDGGWSVNGRWSSTRSDYNNSSESAIADHHHITGLGKNFVNYYSNWVYMFRKTGAMGGNIGDVLGHAVDLIFDAEDASQYKADAVTADWTRTILKYSGEAVSNVMQSNCKSARMDMGKEEIQYEFEIKD